MPSLINLVFWNSGWAAALAVVVFGLALMPAFRKRPALLHLLWFGVLLRLMVPALVQIPILPNVLEVARVQSEPSHFIPQQSSSAVVSPNLSATEEDNANDVPTQTSWFRLPIVLVAISLGGTVVLLTLCIGRWRRITRLLHESQDAPARLIELTGQLAQRLSISTVPRVRLVEQLAVPSIWIGWRHATILLPQHLVGTLDDNQWSCILAHELAHLARCDHWFNLAAAGAMHLYWWNPIAWWAWREMRAHQEACCDAMAISYEPLSRRLYAETLLQVVGSWNRNSHFQKQVLLGFGDRSVLTRRFEMIANPSVRPRAAALAMICLVLGAVSFVCLPVRAEKKEQAASDEQKSAPAEDAKKTAAPALTNEELAKWRHESRDNIRTILLAMHDYHDKFGSFPPPVLYGKGGKGGKHPHSWRVALLPHLEQAKLYEMYKFDEPWDSPANIDVLAKMPDAYRVPGANHRSLDTCYFVLVGKMIDDDSDPAKLQTCFSSKKGIRVQQITDGTSHTLGIVQAKRVIKWTEPQDIAYDPTAKPPEFGGLFEEGFYSIFMDGAVHFLSGKAKESIIKALISPAGGEIIPETIPRN